MSRFLTVALLVLAPLAASAVSAGGGKAPKDLKFDGQLTNDDPKDKQRNSPCKIHIIPLKAGTAYAIEMNSTAFDSYLRLEDPAGKQLAEDDDGGGNLNSRIELNCTQDGDYRIICTTFNGQVGAYMLSVKGVGVAKTASAHEALLDKPAPDFQADFAVNGKPVKVSELKGKVVLVEFFTVVSEGCAATFPRLRKWREAHAADGLEVIGVTYYTYEIGQKLGFDKAEGRLKRLDEASKETDRAMLKDYAEYHKLGHLLMALPKEEALKAFDAYTVNGVPQLVLIDRKGVVRAVRVGEDERTAAAVESEMKKLLAEK